MVGHTMSHYRVEAELGRSIHGHPQFLRLMADLKRGWTSFHEEFASGVTIGS